MTLLPPKSAAAVAASQVARQETPGQHRPRMIAEQGAAAPVDVWVGLGANLGEREEALRSALQRMAEWPGTRLIAVSRPVLAARP